MSVSPECVGSKTLFVSFSHDVLEDVKDLVEFLRKQSLQVNYSGDLKHQGGMWGEKIRDEIEQSDVLLAILDHSVCSKRHGHVHLEIQHALDCGLHLIPVIVGEFRLHFDYQGLIQRHHKFRTGEIAQLADDPEFCAELSELSGQSDTRPQVARRITPREWMAKGVDAKDLSLALALVFLSYEPPDIVFSTAIDLEKRLDQLLGPDEEASGDAPKKFGLSSRSNRLESANALVATVFDSDLGLDVPFVRYKDDNWASELLVHIWTEEPEIRSELTDWLAYLVSSIRSPEIQQRIAIGVGMLTNSLFFEASLGIVADWLRSPNPRIRRTADLALAVAAENPRLKKPVVRLVDEFLELQSTKFTRAALELAFGYTGMRLPDLAVNTLKKIGRRVIVNDRLFSVAVNSPVMGPGDLELSSIDGFDLQKTEQEVSDHEDSSIVTEEPNEEVEALDSKLDETLSEFETGEVDEPELENRVRAPHITKVANFLGELGNWASAPSYDEKQVLAKQVPMLLLLSSLQKMPLYRANELGAVALDDLADPSTVPPETFQSIVLGVANAALASARDGYHPKMHVKHIVQRFGMIRQSSKNHGAADPYLLFCTTLFRALENEEQGQGYLVHLFTGRFANDGEKRQIAAGGPLIGITKYEE